MPKDTKRCSKCGATKPTTGFIPRTDRPGKTQSACRQCVKKYQAARYTDKRDHVRATVAAWQEANRGRVRANAAAYAKAHPELRLNMNRKRRALSKSGASVPFTAEQLASRMAYFGTACWICRGPFEHLDHVKPLSKGGAHMLANLRPACASCNSIKQARWTSPRDLASFIR